MSMVEQRLNDLIKRIDALQMSINTLTALVNARLPVTHIPVYPAPEWPTPQRPPSCPPFHVTCKNSAVAKGETK